MALSSSDRWSSAERLPICGGRSVNKFSENVKAFQTLQHSDLWWKLGKVVRLQAQVGKRSKVSYLGREMAYLLIVQLQLLYGTVRAQRNIAPTLHAGVGKVPFQRISRIGMVKGQQSPIIVADKITTYLGICANVRTYLRQFAYLLGQLC